jgi:DNA/RNA-binding domain of Phe-tRNA-synthetase-like protein
MRLAYHPEWSGAQRVPSVHGRMLSRRALGRDGGMTVREFSVEGAIFTRFPGMRIVVVIADGIDNRASRASVDRMWRDDWAGARDDGEQYENAQSHPRVQPWRTRFTAMGVSGKKFPSSIEALLRRALRDPEPFQINPLVDFYNGVSLRVTVPAGGFDLQGMDGPFELRLTRPGDHFVALDADEPDPIVPGEVGYMDGSTVLTRHFVWRQARAGLIRPETTSVVLLAEVPGEVGAAVADQVRAAFEAGLRDHFGVTANAAFVVSEDQPDVTW